ncbi:HD-GYP domain-containing protein [Sporolactobacillus spathodeae]|uniref:HD-GYP domain-containing protein (C-di-GMP phosphodiesterase class II) n=1 Tax=Sporolactobacillus spathodeae TaxID=1465502 RepID=A0ABS2Q792_9BACL|nr:HD domain-containing phosphohydrolase [Sporolactobacillus spathodeae]MBM7657526.1 HD-GYP domain-containing protein (c-di-GMP phosphodiesterase class II) [Sporolactobacillus spathodeae]
MIVQKLESFLTKRLNDHLILMICYIWSIAAALLVACTNGTSNVFTNIMYLPIACASATNSIKKAAVHALISGLLIGPLMPLTFAPYQNQKLLNWIIRLIIFIIISLVISFIAKYHRKEFNRNLELNKELSEAQMATIYSLVKLLESRDAKTGFHVERVAALCQLLAIKLQKLPKYQKTLSKTYIESLVRSSALHDIGKVAIPDRILLKPGKLSPEEFEIMKTHTTLGADTLAEVFRKYPGSTFLKLGIQISRFHHEHWDGSGYPEGLRGDDIPLCARIVALADVYEALRSERPYKKAYSHEKSLAILKQGRGSHFDPDIVAIFDRNSAEFLTAFEQF